jgi:hypothetical protein
MIPAAAVAAITLAVSAVAATAIQQEPSRAPAVADRVAQASTAATPSLAGTWTGTVFQNKGKTNYTVVMTISVSGAETDYPELKCGGKLTRVGASGGYVFYTETITRGGQNSGGGCIDGTITVAPAGDNLAWGWMGSFRGDTFVAWSTLKLKR